MGQTMEHEAGEGKELWGRTNANLQLYTTPTLGNGLCWADRWWEVPSKASHWVRHASTIRCSSPSTRYFFDV